jgi:hypothetical protein
MNNITLWSIFDKSDAQDAILGEGDRFLADYTYPERHDTMTVIDQLFGWGKREDANSTRHRRFLMQYAY